MFTRRLVNRATFPTKHIVVCEDDLFSQSLIAARLNFLFAAQGKVQVSYVSGGEMAAAIMQNDIPVDLILLDHDMPYGSGSELLTWMKDNNLLDKIKVITFSGIRPNNENMMLAGAHIYLMKNEVIHGQADELMKEILAV